MRSEEQVDHRAVAAACRANPRDWQPVGEYGSSESAKSAVRMIRGALRRSSGESPYAPARTFEARHELTDAGARVEARYVGPLTDRISPLALTAKQVIDSAWRNGPNYDLSTQAAEALESARLLQSPETVADLEAGGMYAAADVVDEAFHGEPHLNYPPDFAALIRQKAQEKSSREADATPALTVYRADWDSIALGTYTTEAEARKHAEDHVRRDLPTASFDWIVDEEDGVAELVATVDGSENPTGYFVTALEIASKYDPEADE
ncbi:hypothetical protein [Streptomyces sp. NPDC093223]|uniref:hypothetical protein n=1 Tax=Streptomyces sp. NPDC093223 TaxID=3366033 RepID=UPI0038144588